MHPLKHYVKNILLYTFVENILLEILICHKQTTRMCPFPPAGCEI